MWEVSRQSRRWLFAPPGVHGDERSLALPFAHSIQDGTGCYLRGYWMYRQAETSLGCQISLLREDEVFLSKVADINLLNLVISKCIVRRMSGRCPTLSGEHGTVGSSPTAPSLVCPTLQPGVVYLK